MLVDYKNKIFGIDCSQSRSKEKKMLLRLSLRGLGRGSVNASEPPNLFHFSIYLRPIEVKNGPYYNILGYGVFELVEIYL